MEQWELVQSLRLACLGAAGRAGGRGYRIRDEEDQPGRRGSRVARPAKIPRNVVGIPDLCCSQLLQPVLTQACQELAQAEKDLEVAGKRNTTAVTQIVLIIA